LAWIRRSLVAASVRVIYLHGIGGGPALSPAMTRLADAGVDVIAPRLPGFDGRAGFRVPHDHLGWLTRVWDLVDDTGALPCPVIGASIGGLFAAELAIYRPEAVPRVGLLAPLGLCDAAEPGVDLYARPGSQRYETLFAGPVPAPFETAYAELGEEQGVARYLAQVAGASLVWPVPDRDLDTRLHRIRQPRLVLWGERDTLAPPALATRWAGHEPPVIVDNAGHLLEWDAPAAVADALLAFLADGSAHGG
jgi:pimeloyl-ACP methyl ester carboxylesterase